MRARPQVKTYLLATKLKRWARIGAYPSCYPNCSPTTARRNYARLYARHESLARALGLTPLSAYPPL
jgi:hypothetical protein